jgi:hypothetical protein
MAYLQQKSVMQAEAKAVMWQLSKEVQNAVKVEFDIPDRKVGASIMPNSGCLQPQPGSGNCIVIYEYDYGHYTDKEVYEDPKMFQRLDEWGSFLNYVKIFYEVLQETPGNDYNKNGRIEDRPYLLKRTEWESYWGAYTVPKPDLGAPWDWASGGSILYQTYFLGRIVPGISPPTFASYGGQQLFKVTFKLKTSYDRASEAPRYFSSIVAMDSLPSF